MKSENSSITKATLQEQKELVSYVRSFINKNGNPYDNVEFDFDHHQQRDCLNWLNFIGFINDLEESNEKGERLDVRHIRALREIVDKFFIDYYKSEFKNSHKLMA